MVAVFGFGDAHKGLVTHVCRPLPTWNAEATKSHVQDKSDRYRRATGVQVIASRLEGIAMFGSFCYVRLSLLDASQNCPLSSLQARLGQEEETRTAEMQLARP